MQGLNLVDGEKVILSETGGYVDNHRSGWKLGRYYLTSQRLIFAQRNLPLLDLPYSSIIGVTIEKKAFVLSTRKVICILYRNLKQGISRVWLAVNHLDVWRRKIYEMTSPAIKEEAVDEIAGCLDRDSEKLVWHLWQKRHARIDELAEIIGAPTHMDVLLKIKEIINPAAEKIMGNPILTFKEREIDPESGEGVLFSWWFIGKKEEPKKDLLLDVFDEGEDLIVIVELPAVQEKDISFKVEKNKFAVSTNGEGPEYYKEVSLPVAVNCEGFTRTYNNGILQVKFKKG